MNDEYNDMAAGDLILLMIEHGRWGVVYELIQVVEILSRTAKESEARGNILDVAIEKAKEVGYTGNCWTDAIEYLAVRAGCKSEECPF